MKTVNDKIAVYNMVIDSYKQLHSTSYKLLHRGLKKALKHIPEEVVIYLLMQEVRNNRKVK